MTMTMTETKDVAKELAKKEASTPEGVERTRERKAYIPRTDIYEEKDNVYLIADMPGVDEKHVDITLDKNILTVAGYVDSWAPDGLACSWREYGVGDYQRAFTLSDEIDREGIKASVKDGVLTLSLPKVGPAKARKIPVAAV